MSLHVLAYENITSFPFFAYRDRNENWTHSTTIRRTGVSAHISAFR